MALVALELQQSLQRFDWAIRQLEKKSLIRRGQNQLEIREPLPSEYPGQEPDERELKVNQNATPTSIDLEWIERWKERKAGWPLLMRDADDILTELWQGHDRAKELIGELSNLEEKTLDKFETSWKASLRLLLNHIVRPLLNTRNRWNSGKQGKLILNHRCLFDSKISDDWPNLAEELNKYIHHLSPLAEEEFSKRQAKAKRQTNPGPKVDADERALRIECKKAKDDYTESCKRKKRKPLRKNFGQWLLNPDNDYAIDLSGEEALSSDEVWKKAELQAQDEKRSPEFRPSI